MCNSCKCEEKYDSCGRKCYDPCDEPKCAFPTSDMCVDITCENLLYFQIAKGKTLRDYILAIDRALFESDRRNIELTRQNKALADALQGLLNDEESGVR